MFTVQCRHFKLAIALTIQRCTKRSFSVQCLLSGSLGLVVKDANFCLIWLAEQLLEKSDHGLASKLIFLGHNHQLTQLIDMFFKTKSLQKKIQWQTCRCLPLNLPGFF